MTRTCTFVIRCGSIAALQAAGRQVELVILPEDRHRARTPDGVRMRDARTVAHLLTHLGVPLPEELVEETGPTHAG